MAEALDRLRAAMASEFPPVPFTGAGLSAAVTGGAAHAGWRGLIADGIAACDQVASPLPPGWADRMKDQLDHADAITFASVADEIARRLRAVGGGSEFGTWIRRTVGRLYPTPAGEQVIEAVRDLADIVVTTNLDTLVEDVRPRWRSYTWTDGEHKPVLDSAKAVFHLRGVVDNPDSVIFGSADFGRPANDELREVFTRSLFASRRFIFIGCGDNSDDPDSVPLMEFVAMGLMDERMEQFILVRDRQLRQVSDHLLSHRITPVAYGSGAEDLTLFLRKLAAGEDLTRSREPGRLARGPHPIYPSAADWEAPEKPHVAEENARSGYLAGLPAAQQKELARLNSPGLRSLRRYLDSGQAIAFLGEGASAPLYPPWNALIGELVDAATPQMGEREADACRDMAHQHPEEAVELVRRALGAAIYQEILRQVLRVRVDPESGRSWTPVQELVCRCAFKAVVTTDYNPGILDARIRVRPGALATGFTTWEDELGLDRWRTGDVFGDDEMPVLFAHGQHNRPDSVVLATTEYRRAYAGKLPQVLARLLDGHLAWIGFSFADQRIAAILREVADRTGTRIDPGGAPRHVALMPWDPDGGGNHPGVLARRAEIAYGAELVLYPAPGGNPAALELLLADLTDSRFGPPAAMISQPRPPAVAPTPATVTRPAADKGGYQYDVCLSFAGEQRDYVEQVADGLRQHGVLVFYDTYEKTSLWGRDLYEHLDWIYGKAAKYCVLFASADYASKIWTTHERRSAQARALEKNNEVYILPARFDDTDIPGLRPSLGYIDLRITTPQELTELIIAKLGK